MTVARHLRLTEADKVGKLERQRTRRLVKPGVNGQLRKVLGDRDYLTLYHELFRKQKGLCGICRKPPGSHRFHMDHNHETLEIRGLLCYSCNTKLAFVEKYYSRIVRYLQW